MAFFIWALELLVGISGVAVQPTVIGALRVADHNRAVANPLRVWLRSSSLSATGMLPHGEVPPLLL